MVNISFVIFIFLFPLIASLIVSMPVGLYLLDQKPIAGSKSLAGVFAFGTLWTFGYLFFLISPDLAGKIFWDKLQYLGIFFTPLAVLSFAIHYNFIKLSRKQFVGLFLGLSIVPLFMLYILYANPFPALTLLSPGVVDTGPFSIYTYKEGPLLIGGYIFSYVEMAVGMALMIRAFQYRRGIFRVQALIYSIGFLIPLIGSSFSLIGIQMEFMLDFAPYAISISQFVIAIAIFRYHILDITQVARNQVVSSMDVGVIVTDLAGNLLDINPAARKMVDFPAIEPFGQSISAISEFWAKQFETAAAQPEILKEIEMAGVDQSRYFGLKINFINEMRRFSPLRIITIQDITRQKRADLDLQDAFDEMELKVSSRTAELSNLVEELESEIHDRKIIEEALKESESRFRAIIEQSSDGIMLLDYDGKVIELNEAMERITRLRRQEVLWSYSWEFQYQITLPEKRTPENQLRAKTMLLEAIETGKSPMFSNPSEATIITRDGQKRIVQQTAFLIKTDKGNRIGSIIRDITLQKKAENDLQELNLELEKRVKERTAQLESINKELESFSYSVSHDLRGPLRSLNGFASVLREDFVHLLPAEGIGYLERIEHSAKKLDELIDSLLLLSRLGRKPLEKQNILPGEIAIKAWEELRDEFEQRSIHFTIDDLPACMADPVLLKQIYVNLLSNALKYTRPRPEAIISVGFSEEAGETIFWVKDNGVGFDMKYVDKLFGSFQRLHNEKQFEGIGIGLTIVYRIIQRHGGRIWAEGQVDHGAAFYFTIGK